MAWRRILCGRTPHLAIPEATAITQMGRMVATAFAMTDVPDSRSTLQDRIRDTIPYWGFYLWHSELCQAIVVNVFRADAQSSFLAFTEAFTLAEMWCGFACHIPEKTGIDPDMAVCDRAVRVAQTLSTSHFWFSFAVLLLCVVSV